MELARHARRTQLAGAPAQERGPREAKRVVAELEREEFAPSAKHAVIEQADVGGQPLWLYTATAAGMIGVGVLWGFRGRSVLEAGGARHIVREPAEVLRIVAGG